jgi:hypothetical protein
MHKERERERERERDGKTKKTKILSPTRDRRENREFRVKFGMQKSAF